MLRNEVRAGLHKRACICAQVSADGEQTGGSPGPTTESYMGKRNAIAVHPGDLVQIIDKADARFGAILLVQEARRWGVGGIMQALQGQQLVESYQRVKPAQFAVVGAAAVMSPEVAGARADSLKTAQAAAQEAK